jgi:exodeoxyribonuclease VIII
MNGNLAEQIESLPPGVYKDIPAEQYHALPYVSSSFLKKFRKNPAAALLPEEDKACFALGGASHAYSLEGDAAFLSQYIVMPSDAPKRPTSTQINAKKPSDETVKAIDWWDKFEKANAGKILLTADQAAAVFGIDKSLKSHPLASMLLKRGNPELTLIWDDPGTGLRCKARIDLNPERRALIDYKTCADVAKFDRQMVTLNYDIQAGHYSIGAVENNIDHDTFIFVAAETSEPHPVRCGYIHPDWLQWARDEVRRLLCLVAECKVRGAYPNYEIPLHIVSLDQIRPADLLEEWEMPKWR